MTNLELLLRNDCSVTVRANSSAIFGPEYIVHVSHYGMADRGCAFSCIGPNQCFEAALDGALQDVVRNMSDALGWRWRVALGFQSPHVGPPRRPTGWRAYFPAFGVPAWFDENCEEVTYQNDAMPMFDLSGHRFHVDSEDPEMSEFSTERAAGSACRFAVYKILVDASGPEGEQLSPPVLETNSLSTLVEWAERSGLVKTDARP